jgi:hypothetical protein
LRDPESSIEKMVSKVNQKEDELKTNRESDQLIVLRERESRSQAYAMLRLAGKGKELTVIRNLQRKHYPYSRDGENNANLTARNSRKSETRKEIPVSKSLHNAEQV